VTARGWIGYLKVDLLSSSFQTLKDRRSWIRSTLDQARGKFNVSVGDLSPDGAVTRVTLCFALAGSSSSDVEGRLGSLRSLVSRMAEDHGLEVLDFWEEVLCDDDI
jgi:hypothetical protein